MLGSGGRVYPRPRKKVDTYKRSQLNPHYYIIPLENIQKLLYLSMIAADACRIYIDAMPLLVQGSHVLSN
jgi:hypothetical protein